MQKWEYKVDVEGGRYVTVPGGFKHERNGAKFQEVRAADGSGSSMLLASLPDGKGGMKYDVMSPDNWRVMAHNGDVIASACKAYSEGSKAREAAKIAEVQTQVKTLKGAGLQTAEVEAILKSRGINADLVKAALA